MADRIKAETQADLFKTNIEKARPSAIFWPSDEADPIKTKTK